MKYNKFYNIPSHLFIEHYEVVDDKIIIYHADGTKNEVDYSVECEKKILNTISEQLQTGKSIMEDIQDQPTPLMIMVCSLGLVVPFMLFELSPVCYLLTCVVMCGGLKIKYIIDYNNIVKEMSKSTYILDHLDCLENYDARLMVSNKEKATESLHIPIKFDIPGEKKQQEAHVVNSLEIYSLESLRAIIESWKAQKLYVDEEDIATFKKNAPELVLEEQKVKKLSKKK